MTMMKQPLACLLCLCLVTEAASRATSQSQRSSSALMMAAQRAAPNAAGDADSNLDDLSLPDLEGLAADNGASSEATVATDDLAQAPTEPVLPQDDGMSQDEDDMAALSKLAADVEPQVQEQPAEAAAADTVEVQEQPAEAAAADTVEAMQPVEEQATSAEEPAASPAGGLSDSTIADIANMDATASLALEKAQQKQGQAAVMNDAFQLAQEAEVSDEQGAERATQFAKTAAQAMMLSGNDQLDELEKSVLALALEGASPGMTAFVTEIRTLLTNKMKREIESQHNATKATLAKHWDDIGNCSVNADLTNNTTLVELGLNPGAPKYDLDLKQLDHRTCRENESTLKNHSVALRALATAYKDVMTRLCDLWHANETNRTSEVGDSTTCTYKFVTYGRPSYTNVLTGKGGVYEYYKDQFAFWNSEYLAIKAAREACDSATLDYKAADANATQAESDHTEARERCNGLQDAMDKTSCMYEQDLQDVCNRSNCCVDTNWQLYNETLVSGKIQSTFLQAQMKAVLRIHCYLDVLDCADSTSTQVGVQTCKIQDFSNDPNVTSLTLTENTKPAPVTCQYSKDHVAGYCAYESGYYYYSHFAAKACSQSCCTHITGPPLAQNTSGGFLDDGCKTDANDPMFQNANDGTWTFSLTNNQSQNLYTPCGDWHSPSTWDTATMSLIHCIAV